MSNSAVKMDNLVKKFGDFTAVDNISLDIKEGEMFGILGPNGAGKTTTINMVLGLLRPTSGRITINGMDNIKYAQKVKSLIGLMTQETVVEGDLTARENLTLFAQLYHVPEDQIPAKVKDALKASDLTNFADKKAGTFSGGMQRRLELVKAMIQDPRILILDEPTTGLDIQNRVSMWERLRKLNQEGVTLILTTQYLEEADILCDRIAIIDHGKIKAIGTPSELKRMVGTGRVLELVIEDPRRANEVADLLKDQFKLGAQVKADKVTTVIEAERGDLLTRITGALEKKKIIVSSVSLHLPTLDDVFIKLTGTGLRDSASNEAPSTRSNMFMRR
jgi:ABC-2 type transport system ATP-binding protein